MMPCNSAGYGGVSSVLKGQKSYPGCAVLPSRVEFMTTTLRIL